MAKEFDIYIRSPLVESDICLKDHLTECDIIVYSIPYRDGITVADRLVLKCCLETYSLEKPISLLSKSELISYVNEIIKTYAEKADNNTEIVADAEIKASCIVYPYPSSLELASDENLDNVKTVFEKIDNNVYLSVAGVDVSGSLETNVLNVKSNLWLKASITNPSKQVFECVDVAIIPDIKTTDLYHRLYSSGENICNIATSVSHTELRRYRSLSEMDNNPLSDYDNMKLDDVDYITL